MDDLQVHFRGLYKPVQVREDGLVPAYFPHALGKVKLLNFRPLKPKSYGPLVQL